MEKLIVYSAKKEWYTSKFGTYVLTSNAQIYVENLISGEQKFMPKNHKNCP